MCYNYSRVNFNRKNFEGKEAAMGEVSIKALQKEMNALGIINIEADGDLSPSLLKDAVEAVKETALDFKSIAEKSRSMAATAK